MKKLILPAAIIGLAVGAAFATQKTESSAMIPAQGYRIGGVGEDPCERTDKQCDTDATPFLCTWSDGAVTHNLKMLVGTTSCVLPLYEPIAP